MKRRSGFAALESWNNAAFQKNFPPKTYRRLLNIRKELVTWSDHAYKAIAIKVQMYLHNPFSLENKGLSVHSTWTGQGVAVVWRLMGLNLPSCIFFYPVHVILTPEGKWLYSLDNMIVVLIQCAFCQPMTLFFCKLYDNFTVEGWEWIVQWFPLICKINWFSIFAENHVRFISKRIQSRFLMQGDNICMMNKTTNI